MTTLTKTKCPYCHKAFDVPQAQLNQEDVKGRCSHCQQVFFINDHLLPSDNHDTQKHHTTENTPSIVKTTTETNIDSAELIHDDMEIEDAPDTALDYGSLDEMDAWLTQLDIEDEEPQSAANHQSGSLSSVAQTPEPAISSVEANDIHADISKSSGNHISENAWLENLLQEQNNTPEYVDDQQNDTDLSQLLTDMGMPAEEPQKPTAVIAPSTSTRTQTSIATILWSAGCLVLALLLFAQYLIFNLDTIIKDPDHAAKLQSVCAVAACSLPYADIDAFTVTKVAYQPSRVNTAPTFSDVTADVVNQSQNMQLLPSLKVSIYGDDGLIGAFIAQPKDYLLSAQSQIAADSYKSVMFTVPVAAKQIKQVSIEPLY